MHIHGLGNTQPVRVGLRQRRSRAGWQRSAGYAERRDSSTLAQIFSRPDDCVGIAVFRAPNVCQIRVMKCSTR